MNNFLSYTKVASLSLVLLLVFLLSSCIDNNYDASEDMDLTVGLGTKGLQFKIGSTDTIRMEDILEVNENDLHADNSQLLWLVKSGSTTAQFAIHSFRSTIPTMHFTTSEPLFTQAQMLEQGLSKIPAGWYSSKIPFSLKENFSYKASNISSDIKSLSCVTPQYGTKVRFRLVFKQEGISLGIQSLSDMQISLPTCLHLEGAEGGEVRNHVLYINSLKNKEGSVVDLCTAYIKKIDFLSDDIEMSKDERTLSITAPMQFEGSIVFSSKDEQEPTADAKVNFVLQVELVSADNMPQSNLVLYSATGKFDPVINPKISPIEVARKLPNFLRDENVRLTINNPIVEFKADMTEIPVTIKASAQLTSYYDETQEAVSVEVPEKGLKTTFYKNSKAETYFFQDALGPFPFEFHSTQCYKVNNLSNLFHRIPKVIDVNLQDGRTVLSQAEDVTITFDHKYTFSANYRFLIPFSFDKGLRVCYTDTITNMGEDIDDYKIQVDSVSMEANVENTLPLDLTIDFIPCDKEGRRIDGFTVTSIKVPAQSTTPVTLDIRLRNKDYFSLLDKLLFHVTADGKAKGELCSSQYAIIKDMRLLLKSPLICNFN